MRATNAAPTPAFWLGTHMPSWLRTAGVALFIASQQFDKYRTLPRAAGPWVLDSGGFSELQYRGQWTVTEPAYVARVRRYRDQIGHLSWAAPQDWMCEPEIIHGGHIGRLRFVGTGLSVAEHQRRTVDNFLRLRELAPELPFIPVVQGYTRDEYLRCVDLYDDAGVDLTNQSLVGLGSVCRRQGTAEAHSIITALRRQGIGRLHGFGVKTLGLVRYGHLLASADSLAWSYEAYQLHRPAPGCPGKIRRPGEPVKNCANCLHYALAWRERVLRQLAGTVRQLTLDEDGPHFGTAA